MKKLGWVGKRFMGDQRTLFFCFCLPWARLIKIYGDREKQGKMKKGDNQMLKRKKKKMVGGWRAKQMREKRRVIWKERG